MVATARKPDLPVLRGTLTKLFDWHDDPHTPGRQTRHAQIAVWCPHCNRLHWHGWDFDDRGPSHRTAHCDDGSPFRDGGYLIEPWKKKDPGYKSHVAPPEKPIERWQHSPKQEKG